MSTTPVIFCHGLESGPVGRKSTALRKAGFRVTAPDFQRMNLEDRVKHFEAVLESASDPIVVGSSYGGAVALIGVHRALARGQQIRGLVLCAPALHLTEPPVEEGVFDPPDIPTVVIHGIYDEVIPVDHSQRFAAKGPVTLYETDDTHSLAESIDIIVDAIAELV